MPSSDLPEKEGERVREKEREGALRANWEFSSQLWVIIFSSAWCWNYFCRLMVSALPPNEGWRYHIEWRKVEKDGWGEGRRLYCLCSCLFSFNHILRPLCKSCFCAFIVHVQFWVGLFQFSDSSFLICHNLFLFVCFFLFFSFLSSIPFPPAYLDDEEDEDPFGDYVISKSHLTVASPRILCPL